MRQKRIGKRYADTDDSKMWFEFGEQIQLPRTTRKRLWSPMRTADGNKLMDEDALEDLRADRTADISINVEFLLIGKLITRLEEWCKENSLSPLDASWYVPLLKQLKAVTPAPTVIDGSRDSIYSSDSFEII